MEDDRRSFLQKILMFLSGILLYPLISAQKFIDKVYAGDSKRRAMKEEAIKKIVDIALRAFGVYQIGQTLLDWITKAVNSGADSAEEIKTNIVELKVSHLHWGIGETTSIREHHMDISGTFESFDLSFKGKLSGNLLPTCDVSPSTNVCEAKNVYFYQKNSLNQTRTVSSIKASGKKELAEAIGEEFKEDVKGFSHGSGQEVDSSKSYPLVPAWEGEI